MTAARQFHKIEGKFQMQRGSLVDPVIAFETWGQLNAARDNAILIFTGLSPSAHMACSPEDASAGWWEDMAGPYKPLDSNRYFLICVNSLGSCFGSTGPASIDPVTNNHYRLNFPVLCIEDIARAGAEVVKGLGITQLYSTVGSSMGGMSALAFCLLFPGLSRSLVSVSASARAEPFAIALRSLQREIIRSDPAWQKGHYAFVSPPISGMRLARKLGMISYRSAAEWKQRFGRERATDETTEDKVFRLDFEVESYLESHANRFIGAFDPNCYLYLSRAMDLFDAADHGGSLEAAVSRLEIERALVIGVNTDLLFPIQQQQELAELLAKKTRDVIFKAMPSIQGHDAFLVDMQRFRPVIADFFSSRS